MCSNREATVVVLAVILPASASAQTVEATSMTTLAGRADPRDGTVHTIVPLTEDIWVAARDLHLDGFADTRIIVAGWVEAVAGETANGDHFTGDLDLAFIEGKLLDRHLTLRAGRQLVSAGVARNLQLDGIHAVGTGPADLGLEVYGGVPVPPRFGYARGQAAFGARVFWRPGPTFDAGASFADVLDDGSVARLEAGLDARLIVAKQLTLTGFAALNLSESRLSEAALRALWQPRRNLELSLEGARTAPDLFISRTSIFSVFAEESHNEIGATAFYRPLPRLRLWADGFVINDDSGTGGRGGLRALWTLSGTGTSQVGAEARFLALPISRYVQGRIFGSQRFATKILATVDVDTVWLDPAINGQDLSITLAATVGWDFMPSWRTLVTGVLGQTPLLDRRAEVMAKLVYVFNYRASRVTP